MLWWILSCLPRPLLCLCSSSWWPCPFFERLCPWLAALVADALAMPAALFPTPDAMMFIGWIFQLGYGFVARDCFQHFLRWGGLALSWALPRLLRRMSLAMSRRHLILSLELAWCMSCPFTSAHPVWLWHAPSSEKFPVPRASPWKSLFWVLD